MLRILPPSGAPITVFDIVAGLAGALAKASVERFRASICSYFGVRHCFFASSGRAALSMLLTALQRENPERTEVLLPALTSFSVPSAVVNAGLKVALYDVDAHSLGPDLGSLEAGLSGRTLCIVVCHLYGYPCDIDSVVEMANRRGIPVIDDAAQAMGARFKGRYAGTLGDAGLFSLSRGKNVSTVDGGIIVTNSDLLAQALSRIELPLPGCWRQVKVLIQAIVLSLLLRPWLYWIPAGLPFLNLGASVFDPDFPREAYTPFQAAIGRRMLNRLKAINEGRVEKARSIGCRVAEWRSRDASVPGLLDSDVQRLFQPLPGAEPVYLRLPVMWPGEIPIRPELGIVRSYPSSLNEIAALKLHLVNDGDFPVAQFLACNVATLPTHAYVTEEDVAAVVKALIE